MNPVFAELSERGDAIDVHFRYDQDTKNAVKAVPGARFVPPDKGGPFWRVPLSLTSGRRLREELGAFLKLGDALKAWGREEARRERNLKSLVTAEDATLERVPSAAPRIAAAIDGKPLPELGLPKSHPLSRRREPRPYQRADIKMMSLTNAGNWNQMGTGKTLELLGALVESGLLEKGPHLISAPVRSLENVWRREVDWWLERDCWTAEDPRERNKAVEIGVEHALAGRPVIVVVNPDMLRLVKLDPEDTHPVAKRYKGDAYGYRNDLQAKIMSVKWASFTIDEAHKTGLANRGTLFNLGATSVEARRRYAMTGTPMGGKTIRLFGYLNWLEPTEYRSKWQWAEQWLEITSNGYGKEIGELQPGREDAFYAAQAKHMVRRLKREALPGLPAKVYKEVMCGMTKAQAKQYRKFAADAEIRIDEERLSGTNVLAEYRRLKQFANAACRIETREKRNGEVEKLVIPTEDSGKLEYLLEKLDECGIRRDQPEPRARAIVASESARMVEMVTAWLNKKGIAADAFTGKTKNSAELLDRFNGDDEEPYVIVMTTQTGGVSLNMEAANSVHVLDETWDPDDQEQLEDRGDRGSRTTPLVCYYYRTKDTIQEYVNQVTEGKKVTNKNVLDLRKRGLHA